MRELVIGTRGSRLALSQTEVVSSRLRELFPDLAIRIQIIRTTADRNPTMPIRELSSVGFFVKELELALLEGAIDAAVHSMKDLPSAETEGLRIAAMPERGDPRDALVARDGMTLDALPVGARIGTSSPRRAASLLRLRPDLTIVPMRGNVDTRVGKVASGEVDAVCLAAAGLSRIGLAERITQRFPVDLMIPAPGQGALGVQVRETDRAAGDLVAAIDHAPTRSAVLAERTVLRRLEAGCRLPVGAYARVDEKQLHLSAVVLSSDGRQRFTAELAGPLPEWQAIAEDVAGALLVQWAGVR